MNRFHITFFATSISIVFVGTTFSAVQATTVGYWRFEDDLTDSSGIGNHATATGTPFGPAKTSVFGTPVPRTGSENLFSLDLENAYSGTSAKSANHFLTVPDLNNTLDIAPGSFTLEAWVRLDALGDGDDNARQYIVQKKNVASTDMQASYSFMAKAGNLGNSGLGERWKMALALPDGTNENLIISSLGLLNATGWHYMSVAVDRPSGDVRFILDDLPPDIHAGAALGLGLNNNDTLYIGARSTNNPAFTPPGADYGFSGGIDELRISNTFLSTSELLAVPEPASVTLAIAGVTLLIGYMAFAARQRSILRR